MAADTGTRLLLVGAATVDAKHASQDVSQTTVALVMLVWHQLATQETAMLAQNAKSATGIQGVRTATLAVLVGKVITALIASRLATQVSQAV